MKKFVFLLASLFAMSACTVVGPGSLGVRISLGKVSEEPKPPGAYLWIPFLLGMQEINVQVQKSEVSSTAASKDMQDVHAKVAVNWSLSPENVTKTFSTIGDENEVLERIIDPAVNEVMKAATSTRTAEEVLTKRFELKKDIDEGLTARLKSYGITLHDVSIVNLSFSSEFSKAVEEKQIAEQEAKKAVYIKDQATQEAQAQVERAKGEAEAQKLVKSTITSELLQMKAIEKWDGKFPQVMGKETLPFMNLKMENK